MKPSLIPALPPSMEVLPLSFLNGIPLRIGNSSVAAGFPSPAGDYLDQIIDLQEHLIKNPAATYLLRVSGSSMQEANIHDGDVLIVDCSIVDQVENRIVIACLDGDFTVKRFVRKDRKCFLVPANSDFNQIEVNSGSDLRIWGVVEYAIHKL